MKKMSYDFSQSYEDILYLHPLVAMLHLNIKLDAKQVKQLQWHFQSDVMEAIEVEVQKLIECGFIW